MRAPMIWRSVVAGAAAVALAAGCGGDGEQDDAQQGDARAGRIVFLETAEPTCGSCHTLEEAGTTGTIGPSLDEVEPTFEEVVAAVRAGPQVMPAYEDQLSDEQIDNVAAFVSEASSGTEER